MKVLFLLALAGVVVMTPFLKMKKPWAVKLWGRVKWIFVAYVAIVFLSAVLRLALNWDAIYG
jgi:hypothetical protein